MKINGPEAVDSAQKETKLEAVFLNGELNPQARQTVLQQADELATQGPLTLARSRSGQAVKADGNSTRPCGICTSDGSGHAHTARRRISRRPW